MEYTVSKTKRNGIILCASFLILYVLATRLLLLFYIPPSFNLTDGLILNVLFIIPFGYLMLVFFQYFKHYRLTIPQFTVLVIFILEIVFKSTLFTNLFESPWKKVLFITANTVMILAIIVLIISTHINKTKADKGISFIRNYAITQLLVFVLIPIFPLFSEPANAFQSQQIIELTSAIPYIFIIVFGLRLRLRE